LLWWINEIKKINNNVEVNKFVLFEEDVNGFDYSNSNGLLVYPVFMRWNYSGNLVAYYDYHYIGLRKQDNGRYRVLSGDIDSNLYIADKNKNIFFKETFGSSFGINAYWWLTDNIMISVGTWYNWRLESVDVFIKKYIINFGKNIVDKKLYIYEDAISVDDFKKIKLNWIEQRSDYFEFIE
jgi:hypothetical protein